MSKQIICIKARSHSDFELYLIGEKYDIPFEFLMNYKENKQVYKFWTEVGSGMLSAIEKRPTEKTRDFISYAPLSEREKQNLISIQPIRAGEILTKYKGDIAEKEQEFKAMLQAKEKHKIEMLNRKYDPSNIVCINLKITKEQLFAICLSYEIDFLEVMYFIEEYGALNVIRLWIEKKTNTRVAYAYLNAASGSNNNPCETFVEITDALIPKEAILAMSRKPVTTPKLRVTKESMDAYAKASGRGYLIIEKFESVLLASSLLEDDPILVGNSNSKIDKLTIEELNDLLRNAIEEEDYEFAARLRDQINKNAK